MLLILLLLTVALMVAFYCYSKKRHSFWSSRGVKQTNPVLFFGDNLKLVLKKVSFPDFLVDIYNRGKGHRYMGWYQFHEPFLLIRDPELIKRITVKDFEHFTDHREFVPDDLDPLWANNLFARKGRRWRDMRITLSPSFTSSKMKNIFFLMKEASQRFLSHFNEKVELDFRETLRRYANDIIATAAFGIEVDSIKNQDNEFYLSGQEITKSISGGNFNLLILFVFPRLAGILGIKFFGEKCSGFFKELTKDTIKYREDNNINRPDMLNLLMEARKGVVKKDVETTETGFATVQEADLGPPKETAQLSDDDIAAQCLIFFLAGFETISSTMCYMCHELAVNQDVQEKLRQEIEETSKICNGDLHYEGLMKMKYLDMVVSETMRKYPNPGHIDRICTKDYTIEPTTPEEKPLKIEKNMQMFIPVFAIHRDPDHYPDPDKFDPERFSEDNKHKINPYLYLPFGVGPRNCIGSRFALMEIKILFFYLLKKFRIAPSKKSPIPLKFSTKTFMMAPEGGFWYELEPIQ